MQSKSVVPSKAQSGADDFFAEIDPNQYFPFTVEPEPAEEAASKEATLEEVAPDYAESTKKFRQQFRKAALVIMRKKYLDVRHAFSTMKALIPVWEAALNHDRE